MKELMSLIASSSLITYVLFALCLLLKFLHHRLCNKYFNLLDLVKTYAIMFQSKEKYSFEDCFCFVRFMCYRTKGDVYVTYHDGNAYLLNILRKKEEKIDETHVWNFIQFVCKSFSNGNQSNVKYNINGLENIYEKYKGHCNSD